MQTYFALLNVHLQKPKNRLLL